MATKQKTTNENQQTQRRPVGSPPVFFLLADADAAAKKPGVDVGLHPGGSALHPDQVQAATRKPWGRIALEVGDADGDGRVDLAFRVSMLGRELPPVVKNMDLGSGLEILVKLRTVVMRALGQRFNSFDLD
jgi:hypothetical protein